MKNIKIKELSNNLSLKIIFIVILSLLLLIPTVWIQNIIEERALNSEFVTQSISDQWAKSQVVTGPILNIPYSYTEIIEKGEKGERTVERNGTAHFLPNSLNIDVTVVPEIRHRSIYEVAVYKSKLSITGDISASDFTNFDLDTDEIYWEKAYLTYGITDLRGIEDEIYFTVNGTQLDYEPGVKNNDLFSKGLTLKLNEIDYKKGFDFNMQLVLKGSSTLSFIPLGKTTKVDMKSNWADPSFIGSFLPEHKIDDDKFTAKWIVTHLNRNYPQQWLDKKYSTANSSFGVALFLPVDHYQKSTRAIKYAILFILLNFIVFIFIEIRNKKRIHPIQYSLVAFALLLFYTLLISISEQIGFNWAYLISAISITTLITWYSKSIIDELKLMYWIALLQFILYAFLFIVLQMQDFALLIGSIGLFVILGAIMKASKNINWYNNK